MDSDSDGTYQPDFDVIKTAYETVEEMMQAQQ